jgi:hypothetical protein
MPQGIFRHERYCTLRDINININIEYFHLEKESEREGEINHPHLNATTNVRPTHKWQMGQRQIQIEIINQNEMYCPVDSSGDQAKSERERERD